MWVGAVTVVFFILGGGATSEYLQRIESLNFNSLDTLSCFAVL